MPITHAHYIRQFQEARFEDVKMWYRGAAEPLINPNYHSAHKTVQYALLWTTFNALYNIADIPHRKVTGISGNQPTIPLVYEHVKWRRVTDELAVNHATFVTRLANDYRSKLRTLRNRKPTISHPNQSSSNLVHYVDANLNQQSFDITQVRGVASIDKRVVTASGELVFEYQPLTRIDAGVDDTSRTEFINAVVQVLYTVRNNTVHGGKSMYFSDTGNVLELCLPILKDIVSYLLENNEVLIN